MSENIDNDEDMKKALKELKSAAGAVTKIAKKDIVKGAHALKDSAIIVGQKTKENAVIVKDKTESGIKIAAGKIKEKVKKKEEQ